MKKLEYMVVLSADPQRPLKISVETFMEFTQQVYGMVLKYGPFDLIYRLN